MSRLMSEPKPGCWVALAKREEATSRHRSSNPPRPSRPRWSREAEAGGTVEELLRGQRLGQIALAETTKPRRGWWSERRSGGNYDG